MQTLFAKLNDSGDIQCFYKNNEGKLLGDMAQLADIANFSNTAWYESAIQWAICINEKKEKTDKKYKCIYTVIVYDDIIVEIYGFGDTPQKALSDCTQNFNQLQSEHN